MERRVATEWRAEGRRLEGVVVRYGAEAKIGRFTERVAPGAFDQALGGGRDIVALVDHDPRLLLARTRSGTLRLRAAGDGLYFDLDLADTALARDVLTLAERGDLGGMSFGFLVPSDGEAWQGTTRELRAVDLREISVVHAWPAYDGTSVHARAHQACPPRLSLAQRYLETL